MLVTNKGENKVGATRKTEINGWYRLAVVSYLRINVDNEGLYVNAPAEKSADVYTLRCEETAYSIDVKSCSCVGNKEYNKCCKHMIITQEYFDNIYKHNTDANTTKYQAKQAARTAKIVAEVEAVKAETMVHNAPEEFDEACEELREAKVLKVGIKGSDDLAGKGALNGAAQSANAWAILPSRQKAS